MEAELDAARSIWADCVDSHVIATAKGSADTRSLVHSQLIRCLAREAGVLGHRCWIVAIYIVSGEGAHLVVVAGEGTQCAETSLSSDEV